MIREDRHCDIYRNGRIFPEELDTNNYSPIDGWGEKGRSVTMNMTEEIESLKTFGINQVRS